MTIAEWWESKRLQYNVGLVVAGPLAFIAYALVGFSLFDSAEDDFEITLFTIAFQGIGYVFMMGVANLFYFLGPLIDSWINNNGDLLFRKRLYNFGFWFSFGLPFMIPIMLIISSFFK